MDKLFTTIADLITFIIKVLDFAIKLLDKIEDVTAEEDDAATVA